MKNLLWIVTIVFCFFACSKEEENDTPLVSEDNIEVYQKTFDDAVNFMEMNSSISIEDATDYMKTLDGVINVSVEDSLIRVTTQGDICFSIDFYEQPENYEIDNVTESSLQAYIDSIDNATGYNPAKGYEQTSEVFKEYLSTLTRSVEELPITRTTSSSDFVRLSRRNAAIWAPLKGDYEKEANEIIKIANSVLGKEGKEIKVLNGYSPSVFSSFKDYDVVYMSYHGDKGGVISIPVKLLSQKEKEEYKDELKYKRVQGRIKVKDPQKQIVRYILLDSFWEHYLSNLDKTILFSCVCNLGENNSSFLKVCTRSKVNVADFFASDDECRAKKIVNCFKEFYPLLMRGNCSSKAAFKPFQDFFFYEGKGYTFNYKRFGGSKIVYYPIAHATGVGNRTNSNKAKTRGSDSNSSSAIVNAQLRYATEESDDIMKSIEAGICLQDLETKNITLIPFTNKNIISNEKKVYGDITINNISVSLDDLIEKKQYAYCCYIKIDGEISLSNETYKFENLQDYLATLKYSYTYITSAYYDGVLQKTEKEERNSEICIKKMHGIYYIDYYYGPWPQSYIENLLKEKDSVYNQYYIVNNNSYKEDEHQEGSYVFMKKSEGKCSLNEDNMLFTGEFEWGRTGTYTTGSSYEKSKLEIKISNLDTEPILAIAKSSETRWPYYGDWDKQTKSWHNYKEVTEYEFKYEGCEKVKISW